MALGVDEQSEWIRRVKRALFPAKETLETVRPSPNLPDVFRSGPIPNAGSPFGYLRIHTFDVEDEQGFFDEAIRILRELPKGGLILDVRGNSGGLIPAAERLLQLFTTRRIEPEPLRFRNTRFTFDLVSSSRFELGGSGALKRSLAGSIRTGRYTGEPFSAAYPLDPADAYNGARDEDRYPGPVVLVVDGLSYSATDIFAAGFQDHGIGLVLGTTRQTGGGGANVWSYENVRELLGIEPELPYGASFTMAMRASSRVGPRAGYPLEDLGVTADYLHRPTSADVLDSNRDLRDHALGILAALSATRAVIPVA